MGRSGGDPRAKSASGRGPDPAFATPLTPITGDTPIPGTPLRDPGQIDTPGNTPMASAPTPIEGDEAGLAAVPEENVPSHIGRFTVLKRLGSGGMGVVYAAWDEALNRKVALKVLRTRVGLSKRDTGRKRLQREAQAMAKLSHPNVVAIYDVGVVGDQIFLAMEFVKGVTLTRWLQAERRAWRDVLEVFMQAGRGLSAAHRAGIIHRDFKPDNVLIDGEGRVRVVDFGLARADGGSGLYSRPDTYEAITSKPGNSMLDMRITRTGGMTGTPAYMAPEQYLGQPTDARTDQFSFCVALFEGLYGVRPFVGDRVAVVREAVLGGQIQDVPKDSDVPVWLLRILTRGLAIRPSERYRNMDDLLARLVDDPRSPLRRWALVGGAVVLIAAREVVTSARTPVPQAAALAVCDAESALTGVWDDTRRQAVTVAFASSGVPAADLHARRVGAVLDARAEEWRGVVRRTCAQAQAESRPPSAALVACVRRRLGGLRTLTDELLRAEPRAVPRGLAAAWALPPVASCAEPRTAQGATWYRDDALALADLDRAAVLGELGDVAGGLALARVVVAGARETEDLALQAEALHRQAVLERRAGDVAAAERSLLAALWAAEASHQDDLLIDSRTLLLEVLGELGRDDDAVALWPRLAEVLQRRSDDGRRESAALHAVGRLLLRRGRHAEAATQLALALRLGERSLGAEHPQVGRLLLDLALAQARLGAHEEAARQLDRAIALLQAALPHDDPALVQAHLARAEVERRRGRLREAAADYEVADGLLLGAATQDLEALAEVQLGLGEVARLQGRWAAAEAGFTRALTLRERVRGPTDPSLIVPLIGQCDTASSRGQHAAAVAACRRALQIGERPNGSAGVGAARLALARALWAQAAHSGTANPAVRGQILGLARAGLAELQGAAHPDPLAIAAAAEWIAGHSEK
jgi:tetratricopeptide (TPR) repeat protein/predicted Ser/Thr protein kinase